MRSRVAAADLAGSKVEANGVVTKEGKAVGVMVEDKAVVGYNTPSRKLELFSKTMADWKWPEFTLAGILPQPHSSLGASGVDGAGRAEDFDPKYMPLVEWPKDAHGEVYTLLPIFRLPNLIHTRSGNAKFLVRDFAQESAVGESGGREETWRHSHRRSDEGPHRDRLLRAACLGHRGADAGCGGLFSSSGTLAHQ